MQAELNISIMSSRNEMSNTSILSLFFVYNVIAVIFILYTLFWFLKFIFNGEERSAGTTTNTNPTPPGSSGFPLIGETPLFLVAQNSKQGLYGFVQARRNRYGNCFRTSIFGKTHVFVSSIDSAKMILSNDSPFISTFIRSISDLLGERSILCASGDYHRTIRLHISNLLNRDTLIAFIRLFDDLTVQAQERWTQKETVIVLDEASKIIFRAICKMLLGLENESELEMLQTDVSLVCEAMLAIPLRLPWTRFCRGLEARKRIMKTLEEMIDTRRKGGLRNNDDFLQSLLINQNSSSEGFLTDAQIQDNILTLIIAGQVTTASAIAWMVKYLDENQEVQKKLRNAQFTLDEKLNSGTQLTLEALNEMSYASKVVKETLRMSTIVTWFPMIALKDCDIEGFHIKKGWIVNVDARSLHFDPSIYESPTKFHPSRFEEDPKPYSFLAFGTGGRTCLGMNLAKAMMLVFIHRLTTTYRWKVTNPDLSLQKHSLFPRLRSGCPIRITPTLWNSIHTEVASEEHKKNL